MNQERLPATELWPVASFTLSRIPMHDLLIVRMDFLPAVPQEGEQAQTGRNHVLSIELARQMAQKILVECDLLERSRSPRADSPPH